MINKKANELYKIRKARGLSQAKLGRLVFERLDKSVSELYPQKWYSNVENGLHPLTNEEASAVAYVLQAPVSAIKTAVRRNITAQPTFLTMMNEVVEKSESCILITLYNTNPHERQELDQALLAGLQNRLSYALCVHQRHGYLDKEVASAANIGLSGAYLRVTASALQRFDYMRNLGRNVATNKLQLFSRSAPFPFIGFPAPVNYSLLVWDDSGEHSSALWSFTESESHYTERILLKSPRSAWDSDKLSTCRGYFADIIKAWEETGALDTVPDTSWVKFMS